MLLLTEKDVESLIGMEDMPQAVEIIEQAYRHKAESKATLHPRSTIEYPPGEGYYTDSAIRILAGIVPGLGGGGLRVFGQGHEQPVADSGPGQRLDYKTSQEIFIYYRYSEGMRLAAIIAEHHMMNVRTAAPPGVATRWQSRKDSTVLALIGAGRHASWQAAAVCAVRPIKEIRVFSPTPANRQRVARVLDERPSPHAYAVDSAQAAVEGADVVVTVTNANQPVIRRDWLSPGTHVNVIARGEIDEETVLAADHITCSWREQILHDTPEFRPVADLVRRGSLSEEQFLDLDEAVVAPERGRSSDRDLTLFLSQGVGLWDAAIGCWVYDLAVQRGVGRSIDLVS